MNSPASVLNIKRLTINLHPQESRPDFLGSFLSSGALAGIAKAKAKHVQAERYELAFDGTIVIDHQTDLMWAASPSDRMTYAKADAFVSASRLGDFDDWRLPTLAEREGIRDLSRVDPALDVKFFKSEGGYEWTSTPYAGGSGFAWVVGSGYGDSNDYHHNYEARVRLVRSASVSQ